MTDKPGVLLLSADHRPSSANFLLLRICISITFRKIILFPSHDAGHDRFRPNESGNVRRSTTQGVVVFGACMWCSPFGWVGVGVLPLAGGWPADPAPSL